MSKKTITWHAWQLQNWPQVHPVREWVKSCAKQEGYVGIPGISEFLQETHNADVIVGKLGDWNGIRFHHEEHMRKFWSCVPPHVHDALSISAE